MVESDTVRSLLDTIERRVARLQRAAGTDLDDYMDDPDLQDIVERNFQLAIQACIDLGLHLLAELGAPPPETNRGVFRGLGDAELLDSGLAGRLEEMAGFRNVLAHEYAAVTPELVHDNLKRLDDIRDYVARLLPRLRERGFE